MRSYLGIFLGSVISHTNKLPWTLPVSIFCHVMCWPLTFDLGAARKTYEGTVSFVGHSREGPWLLVFLMQISARFVPFHYSIEFYLRFLICRVWVFLKKSKMEICTFFLSCKMKKWHLCPMGADTLLGLLFCPWSADFLSCSWKLVPDLYYQVCFLLDYLSRIAFA